MKVDLLIIVTYYAKDMLSVNRHRQHCCRRLFATIALCFVLFCLSSSAVLARSTPAAKAQQQAVPEHESFGLAVAALEWITVCRHSTINRDHPDGGAGLLASSLPQSISCVVVGAGRPVCDCLSRRGDLPTFAYRACRLYPISHSDRWAIHCFRWHLSQGGRWSANL